MSYLGLAGFALMILIVALLLWGKSTPAVVFILLPIIVGFAVGFTAEEMSGYIASGVSGVATTAILFIFAVLFFGVMNDAGVFDVIVGKVLKLVGNNITLLMFATVLIAFIGHLDGSGATTLLICIPPLLPKLSTTTSSGGLILALQRAITTARPEGRYRKHCYWLRYKAVLLESSLLESSACSLIYFCTASSVILPIVST